MILQDFDQSDEQSLTSFLSFPRNRAVALFNLDLKRAETALQAGRLEDAFRILRLPHVMRHSSGQQLIDRLVDAFLKRSKKHFDQEHFLHARRDAELAEKLGGRQIAIASVLNQVNDKDVSIANRASRQADERLSDEMTELISSGQHEAAVAKFRGLRRSSSTCSEAVKLISPSVRLLTERAESDLVSGRLDRCEQTLRTLAGAGFNGTQQQELKLQLNRCYNVRRLVGGSDYAEAIRELKVLARVVPDAAWVGEMIESMQVCLNGVECVKAGPFGLLSQSAEIPVRKRKGSRSNNWIQKPRMTSQPIESDPPNDGPLTSARSILQVDQLGSLLLVQGQVCSVGTAMATDCDVSLQTEGSTDRILICRDGEDYFASSRKAFFVNDLLANRHLLSHGDTIHVGTRGRLKYSRPVAASSSAILHITGNKLKRRDIRSIVLVGDAVVFGSDRGHFRVPGFKTPVIMRAAAGSSGQFLIHRKGDTDHQMLCEGSSLQMNDCQFALASTQTTENIS